MTDPFGEEVLDSTALDEIEMTSALMIAASNHAGALSDAEVDEILGIVSSG